MNAFRTIVIAAVPVAMLWAQPAAATKDFRDVGFLSTRVSEVLESEPTGSVIRWSNPETGNGGRITVTRTYFQPDGTPCREYTRTTETASGTQDRETGTGCRDADGRWALTEGRPDPSGPVSLAPATEPSAAAPAIATEPLPPPAPRPVVAPPPPAAPASPPPAAAAPSPTAPVEAAKTSSKTTAKPKPVIATATIPSRSD
jgi:surface antigen